MSITIISVVLLTTNMVSIITGGFCKRGYYLKIPWTLALEGNSFVIQYLFTYTNEHKRNATE